MELKTSARMDQLAPSGIRKVNEKALAMERAGEHVIHFEIGRPDFDTLNISRRRLRRLWTRGTCFTPPTSALWSCGRRLPTS